MLTNETEAEMADSDDESFACIVTDPDRRRREWVNENYDVLVELFHNFGTRGRRSSGWRSTSLEASTPSLARVRNDT